MGEGGHQALAHDVHLADLCRIDVEHHGIPHLGVMLVDKQMRETLYHKLKENLGRRLVEIADLEIDLDQAEVAAPRQANRA
jgi:hypothetical protein